MSTRAKAFVTVLSISTIMWATIIYGVAALYGNGYQGIDNFNTASTR